MPDSTQGLPATAARTGEALDEAMAERLRCQMSEAASVIAPVLGKFGGHALSAHPAILHAEAAAVLSSAHRLHDAASRLDALAGLDRPRRLGVALGPAEVAGLAEGIRALRGSQPGGLWGGSEVVDLLAKWLTDLGIDPAVLELPGGRP